MSLSFVDDKYDYAYSPPSKKYEFACSVKEKKMRIWTFTFEYDRKDCDRSVTLEGKVTANSVTDAYKKVLGKVEVYEQRVINEDQIRLFEAWWCPEDQDDVTITERREYDEDE